jgi:hypothetical protein
VRKLYGKRPFGSQRNRWETAEGFVRKGDDLGWLRSMSTGICIDCVEISVSATREFEIQKHSNHPTIFGFDE